MIYIIIIGLLLTSVTISCALLWKRQDRPDGAVPGLILIPCRADTEDLELSVRSAYWGELLEDKDKRRDVLIVMIDAGENAFRARALSDELPSVEAVDISALTDRILEKYG